MPGRGRKAAVTASTSQQRNKRKRENSLEEENVESYSWGTTEVCIMKLLAVFISLS
jgi:hypothetical protein